MLDAEARRQSYAMLAAVCATAVLAIALVNRIGFHGGTCTFNSFQRSAVCAEIAALPGTIPANAQILHCRREAEVQNSQLRTLSRVNFSALRQLKELALVRCGIEELEADTFSFVSHLRRLDLRHNRIRRISENQFRGISDLEYLLLSGNPLVELGYEAFSGLTIGRLDLAGNPSLEHIADSAFQSSRVLMLVMCGCSLEKLGKRALHHLADSLRELIVCNNTKRLVVEPDVFEGFHLRRLVLTNDQLDSADFLARGNHDEIVIDNNEQLWNASSPTLGIAAAERRRTRKLSLRNTSIASLSRYSRTVDLSLFADVEDLNLGVNKLRAVKADELLPLKNLRALDLSNNSIEQFVGNFSSILLRLDSLDLRNNRLETLPELTWRPLFERLKSAVALDGNRLHFNCEMRWLTELDNLTLVDENNQNDDDNSFRCVAPEIKNASVLVEDDRIYVWCEAVGDPAPRVSWTADGERALSRVEPPSTRRRDAFSTNARLEVTRLANYTCTASNLLGHTAAVLDLSVTLRASPHTWQVMKRRTAQLEIINTPLGFAVTLVSIALLCYLIQKY